MKLLSYPLKPSHNSKTNVITYYNIRARKNHNLPQRQHRLKRTSKTPSHVGPKLCNLLPLKLKFI